MRFQQLPCQCQESSFTRIQCIVNATFVTEGVLRVPVVASDQTIQAHTWLFVIISFHLSNRIVPHVFFSKTITLDGQQTGTVHPSFISLLKY